MFDGDDILVFSDLAFNYIKQKKYPTKSGGHDIHVFNGLITASKNNLRNTYNLLSGKKGYSVLKNGSPFGEFKTQGEARNYIREQEEVDELIGGIKYSFENTDENVVFDYLHLGTNMFESKAIIINEFGEIKTRDF